MKWIAPSTKDAAAETLERRLWVSADELRANSGLKAQEYAAPILGLIFLRFADVGRFDALQKLPESRGLGPRIDAAMEQIEHDRPQLTGVLPKNYHLFAGSVLKELLRNIAAIPAAADYDGYGRIYEYFLGAFARSEGQRGGEFYTPACIVRLLTEILAPYRGRILDPACGSGGMFVSSARFVAEHRSNPASELAIHGIEKSAETGRLCRLNLALHGLSGDIRHGGDSNSYYDDPHNACGRFDFVLANPPFNVNAVDKARLLGAVGPGRRYPFGLPRTDNANYLWIQLFYSALNATGRAGFVMANSASDARASEQELRQELIADRAVDAMIAMSSNLFYTAALPCTLWFLDRSKGRTPRADTVLFVEARHIYRQVDRGHRDLAPAQVGFLANLVRLYRQEALDFTVGGAEAEAKIAEVFGASPKYADVVGLCKAAPLAEVAAHGGSLNPGRYVGAPAGAEVSDEDFREQLQTLNEELEALNLQGRELEQVIARNVAAILGA